MTDNQSDELLPLTASSSPDKEDGLIIQRSTMWFIFRMLLRAFIFMEMTIFMNSKTLSFSLEYGSERLSFNYSRTTYDIFTGAFAIRFLFMLVPSFLGLCAAIFFLYKLSKKETKNLATLDHYLSASNMITVALYTWLFFYVGYVRNNSSGIFYWTVMVTLAFLTYRNGRKIRNQYQHETV
ncbi:hypothetical protein BB559_004447 [Furculomyces boomerangus]|uniref:Uncharacterized protein n=1 Tax=Furculomyces boomerangus TaxID=61424 RepID=A0A2T9YEM9_9FUNG|nr:hypothetical protein BB559_004447 [Furculomyces boomerangus]